MPGRKRNNYYVASIFLQENDPECRNTFTADRALSRWLLQIVPPAAFILFMQHPKTEPTRGDILLNCLAVGLAGISALLLFLLIGTYYGPTALGSFNKVFAVYMILSQVAAFGVHISVLKHLAEALDDTAKSGLILTGAFAALLPISFGVSLLLALAAPITALAMHSPDMEQGLYWAACGLFFFAWNKTLLAAQNALMRLRAYAVYNCLRYVLLLAGLGLHMALRLYPSSIALIFLFAEGLLCLLLLVSLRKEIRLRALSLTEVVSEARKHLWFGLRGFSGQLMLDINARVDVLCLGFFSVDDRTIGIYSMAAILAEAAYQLPMVLRTVYAPKVILMLAGRRHAELTAFVRHIRLRLWLLMGAAALFGTLLYPHILPLLTGRPEYAEGTGYFGVMLAGVAVAAGYGPFSLLLSYGGCPGRQSQMLLFLVLQNFLGNLLLLPFLGPTGAAVSTALAYLTSVALLKMYSRNFLALRI